MKKLLLLVPLVALFACSLSAQLSVEENQILYLSFDVEDDLGLNEQDVELTDENGMDGDEGKFFGCAWFDAASNSYLIFDPIEDWNHGMDWSFSFWIKSDSEDNFWGIMSFATYSGDPNTDFYDEEPLIGGFILSNFDGFLEAQISWLGGLGPEDGVAAWNDGEWHHVVMTHSVENAELNFYMDNTLYAGPEEATWAEDIISLKDEDGIDASLEDDNIKLGVAGRGWLPEEGEEFPETMWFDGYMDDVRLFDVALSEEEITEIFNFTPDEETGISNAQSTRLFRIYPNPASDYIQIQAESNNVEVKIYNISGQKIMRSFGQTKINISSLSQGIYFLEADINGKRAVQKLVIK